MQKHVACKECARKILGRVHEDSGVCHRQTTSTKLEFMSPFQKLWNIKPTVSHFRVFGCVCYVFIQDELRSKFDKKALRCIFVGYDEKRKGWRCCDPTTNRCHVSRNVIFDEASSWWSPQATLLPDSKEIQENVEKKMGDGESAPEKDQIE